MLRVEVALADLQSLAGILRDIACEQDVAGCHEDARMGLAVLRPLLPEGGDRRHGHVAGDWIDGHQVCVVADFGWRDEDGSWHVWEERS